MSLFGLFHTFFGVGLLAKEAISDSIDDTRSREKAEREGRATYLVNGHKMRSTRTGMDAYVDRGLHRGDHVVVRDLKTDKVVQDLTQEKNYRKQIEEIKKAKDNACVFYRLSKYDGHRDSCNIYVSDTIPGYFRKTTEYIDDEKYEIFEKGELVPAPSWYKISFIVETPLCNWGDGAKVYYSDGSLRSLGYTTVKPDGKQYDYCYYYKKGEMYE